MKIYGLIIFSSLLSNFVSGQEAEKIMAVRQSILPAAVDWYIRWHTDESESEPQTCTGNRTGNRLVVTCSPIDVLVVIDGFVGGVCRVRFMRPGRGLPDFGVTETQQVPKKIHAGCEGLPAAEGDFTIRVQPKPGTVDIELSRKAEEASLQYLRFWPKRCEAYFPLIRNGDPFFHTYIVCDSMLDAVLEFRIAGGHPTSVSHWDYTRKGGNLPEGAAKRLSSRQRWIGSHVVGMSSKQ